MDLSWRVSVFLDIRLDELGEIERLAARVRETVPESWAVWPVPAGVFSHRCPHIGLMGYLGPAEEPVAVLGEVARGAVSVLVRGAEPALRFAGCDIQQVSEMANSWPPSLRGSRQYSRVATYTEREVSSIRHEFEVPAEPPYGACWVEVMKAIRAAHQKAWELGLGERDKDLSDDAILIAPRDDRIVVFFTVEREGDGFRFAQVSVDYSCVEDLCRHEMTPAWCALCLGQSTGRGPWVEDVTVSEPFPARYRTRCEECLEDIHPGDPVSRVCSPSDDVGIVIHEDCVRSEW